MARKIKNVRIGQRFTVGGEHGEVVSIGRQYVQAIVAGVQMRVDPLSNLVAWA